MGRWTLGDLDFVTDGSGLLIPIGDERLPCKGDLSLLSGARDQVAGFKVCFGARSQQVCLMKSRL